MKKFLLIIISILGISQLNAQSVSVVLEYKVTTDSFYVYMLPTFTQPVFNLGPSQITIVFSNNYSISAPASGYVATTGVSGGTWGAQDFALEALAPNKKYVAFQTTGANIAGGVHANTSVLLFRFQVTGAGGNCVGGAGRMRNYLNGIDLTDPTSSAGGDFSTVINEGGITDYFSTNTDATMQSCTQMVLPIHFIDINARKINNNAVINWSATGEELNAKYYELERSVDGINFKSIAQVDCRKLSGIQNYEYTDLNAAKLNAATLFYRIKQYDADAKFSVSGTRSIRWDISTGATQIYPNPVKEGFYVSIPFSSADNKMLQLNLIANNGQLAATKNITAAQAANYYFDLKYKMLAAGQYTLQIIFDGTTIETKKLFIAK
jgi:hypothetical protein